MRMRMDGRVGGVMLDKEKVGDSVVLTPLERPFFHYIDTFGGVPFRSASFKVYAEGHGEVIFSMGGRVAENLADRFVVGKPVRLSQVQVNWPPIGPWFRLQVEDVELPGKDISSEEWREYDLPGTDELYYIEKPLRLFVGETTHRVLDSEGVTHCVPKGGVIRWKSTPWMKF